MIWDLFTYAFLARAVAAGVMISLCAALLGVSLVLRHYAMIGDGLSHVGFGAIAIAGAVNIAPLPAAIPAVLVSAFLLLRAGEGHSLRGDAAVGLISSGALAVGVLAVSLGSVNVDLNAYLFGSILSITKTDAVLSVVLSIAMLSLYLISYNRIFAVTFDESFAKATGARTKAYGSLTAILTSLVVVLGMRMMGALLISSLIIFPALTSMRLCRSFRSAAICSAMVSVLCFLAGITFSYLFGTPASASIVAVNLAAYLIFTGIKALARQ